MTDHLSRSGGASEALAAAAIWLAGLPDRRLTLSLRGSEWRAEVESSHGHTWGYGATLSEAIEDALTEARDGGL